MIIAGSMWKSKWIIWVLYKSGASAKLVTVSGAGHIFFKEKHREQAISDILSFLKAEE